MKFDVPQVKKCLFDCDQVYTVRKYETRDLFSVTEVCDIGSCMVEKIKQVESVDDLREFTPLSGFGSVYDWWDKVMQFNAVNGWLYHVTKLEDDFPSPLNDSKSEYAANHYEDTVKVITFSGNRNLSATRVNDALRDIHRMHPQTTWITGMAYGLDLAVAEFAFQNDIPFEAHLPFPAYIQCKKWDAATQKLHALLLTRASAVFTHSDKFSMKAYQLRNVKMADKADLVVAFNRNKKGGTVNMINYCVKSGIPVIDGFSHHIFSKGV